MKWMAIFNYIYRPWQCMSLRQPHIWHKRTTPCLIVNCQIQINDVLFLIVSNSWIVIHLPICWFDTRRVGSLFDTHVLFKYLNLSLFVIWVSSRTVCCVEGIFVILLNTTLLRQRPLIHCVLQTRLCLIKNIRWGHLVTFSVEIEYFILEAIKFRLQLIASQIWQFIFLWWLRKRLFWLVAIIINHTLNHAFLMLERVVDSRVRTLLSLNIKWWPYLVGSRPRHFLEYHVLWLLLALVDCRKCSLKMPLSCLSLNVFLFF